MACTATGTPPPTTSDHHQPPPRALELPPPARRLTRRIGHRWAPPAVQDRAPNYARRARSAGCPARAEGAAKQQDGLRRAQQQRGG